jgi:cell wall-associated NlpC family hydrolase
MVCVLDQFFYVNAPVVNMRELPCKDSKVVSQAVFNEKIAVEQSTGEWSYIRSSDGYSGWMLTSSYIKLDTPYIATLSTSRLSAHVYATEDTEFGPIRTLPYQTKLQAIGEGSRWVKVLFPDKTTGYLQQGDVLPEVKIDTKHDLCLFSEKFLGLPYTWGGRSSFGYDCSGFIQMLYQQVGIYLQRDAKQQILDPRFNSIAIEKVTSGDLLFFGKDASHIQHVGMYLGDQKMIHATSRENAPWIRVSSLLDFEWSGQYNAYYPYRIALQNAQIKQISG